MQMGRQRRALPAHLPGTPALAAAVAGTKRCRKTAVTASRGCRIPFHPGAAAVYRHHTPDQVPVPDR